MSHMRRKPSGLFSVDKTLYAPYITIWKKMSIQRDHLKAKLEMIHTFPMSSYLLPSAKSLFLRRFEKWFRFLHCGIESILTVYLSNRTQDIEGKHYWVSNFSHQDLPKVVTISLKRAQR